MLATTSTSLAEFLQKQLDLYFTDSHKAELEKKILKMKMAIEQLIPDIIKVDACQKEKFDGWQENPSVLENCLRQLEELKQNSTGPKSDIIDVIVQLKKILSDREELFQSKTIGIADWNMDKYYLYNTISLLKSEDGGRIITCEEVIKILNLLPLNECTSELGYYKQFVRSIDEKGKSFTKIFYLLKSGEKSFFHKLDTTETWMWLGNNPLSLFIIKNGQLVEHVLNESNQSVIIPSQTWFSATVKNGEKHNFSEDDVPFALVTCHCSPAFTLNYYHDDILEDEVSLSLINIYKRADSEMQSDIIELLVPQFQERFKQKVSQ